MAMDEGLDTFRICLSFNEGVLIIVSQFEQDECVNERYRE